MLLVKLKLVSIKNILCRWLHIGCLASHIILLVGQLNVLASLSFCSFFYWPPQRVGLSHFLLLFFYWPTQRVGLL